MKLKRKNIIEAIILIVAIILINLIISSLIWRADLTSDKRYTISNVSKNTMRSLDDVVYIRIYLDGEMPVELKKLRQSIKETLDELKVYASQKLKYEFINPLSGNENERDAIFAELSKKGLVPFTTYENDSEGGATQRVLFPSAIVAYGGKERAVNFLNNNEALSINENLNFAVQNIEFELISTIKQLARKEFPHIAFVEGHGELDAYEAGDFARELSQYYKIDRVTLDGNIGILDEYKAVIVAKPRQAWNDADKLVVDQYIMNGGSVAWFIDEINVNEDSLSNGERTMAIQNLHNLDDLLFRYGARINPDLVQDAQCAFIPVNIALAGQPANFKPAPWFYIPLLMPSDSSTISKGLNLVKTQYPSSIDFVGSAKDKVEKSILLRSSQNSKVLKVPAVISLSQINDKITDLDFNASNKVIAAVFEGQFQSGYKNRILSEFNHGKAFNFVGDSKKAKMFVASDGDIIRNDVSRRADRTSIYPLGYDKYTNQTFGNKDFAKNVLLYLTDDDGLLEIRAHNMNLRLLDKEMVALNRTRIIIVNTIVPLLLIIAFGIVFAIVRKHRYSRKKK